MNNLNSTVGGVPVRFSYTITRNPPSDDSSGDTAAVVAGENTINITQDHPARKKLIKILKEQSNE